MGKRLSPEFAVLASVPCIYTAASFLDFQSRENAAHPESAAEGTVSRKSAKRRKRLHCLKPMLSNQIMMLKLMDLLITIR